MRDVLLHRLRISLSVLIALIRWQMARSFNISDSILYTRKIALRTSSRSSQHRGQRTGRRTSFKRRLKSVRSQSKVNRVLLGRHVVEMDVLLPKVRRLLVYLRAGPVHPMVVRARAKPDFNLLTQAAVSTRRSVKTETHAMRYSVPLPTALSRP